MSPMQNTLALMRANGYEVDVAERFIVGANRRKDLFGFIDVVGLRLLPNGLVDLLAVQTTSADHFADRVAKVKGHENARLWLEAGGKIEVHGWKKRKGRWECNAGYAVLNGGKVEILRMNHEAV